MGIDAVNAFNEVDRRDRQDVLDELMGLAFELVRF